MTHYYRSRNAKSESGTRDRHIEGMQDKHTIWTKINTNIIQQIHRKSKKTHGNDKFKGKGRRQKEKEMMEKEENALSNNENKKSKKTRNIRKKKTIGDGNK